MKKIISFIVCFILGSNAYAQGQIDFRVELPESWELMSYSSKEKLWSYESKDGAHRLTVSVLYFSREPAHLQQGEYLDDFLEVRRAEILKITPDVQFTEIELSDYQTAWVAKFNEVLFEENLPLPKQFHLGSGL